MDTAITELKHACIVVSSTQSTLELFENVFGFQSQGGDELHIFKSDHGFEMHACGISPHSAISREGWPGVTPPTFPGPTLTRSVVGLTLDMNRLITMVERSPFAVKLNSFISPEDGAFNDSIVALRDTDDHVWIADRKITRFLLISDRDRASRFYERFLGTERFTTGQNRYRVTDSFDIVLCKGVIPPEFENTSLFQQLSHFCLAVGDLKQLALGAFDEGLNPFQMDPDGNRKDLVSPEDEYEFGYGSIFMYDPDGTLWEFEQAA